MYFLSINDWLRLVNFVLGTVLAVWLMTDKYGPWRRSSSTSRLITFASAGLAFWLGYTGLEILFISRTQTTAPEGVRVIGATAWLIIGGIAVACHHHRFRLRSEMAQRLDPARMLKYDDERHLPTEHRPGPTST